MRRWNPDSSEWFAFHCATETLFPAPPMKRICCSSSSTNCTPTETTGCPCRRNQHLLPASPLGTSTGRQNLELLLLECSMYHPLKGGSWPALHLFFLNLWQSVDLSPLKQGNWGRKVFLLFGDILGLTHLAHILPGRCSCCHSCCGTWRSQERTEEGHHCSFLCPLCICWPNISFKAYRRCGDGWASCSGISTSITSRSVHGNGSALQLLFET